MQPLNVREWLEPLALSDDFAREALEIVEADCTAEYWELREDLEEAAGMIFAEDWRLVEFFTNRVVLLDELADTFEQAGFPRDPDTALKDILDELEELRTENAALKGLEYDL